MVVRRNFDNVKFLSVLPVTTPDPSDEILTTWRNLKTSRSKNLDIPL